MLERASNQSYIFVSTVTCEQEYSFGRNYWAHKPNEASFYKGFG